MMNEDLKFRHFPQHRQNGIGSCCFFQRIEQEKTDVSEKSNMLKTYFWEVLKQRFVVDYHDILLYYMFF